MVKILFKYRERGAGFLTFLAGKVSYSYSILNQKYSALYTINIFFSRSKGYSFQAKRKTDIRMHAVNSCKTPLVIMNTEAVHIRNVMTTKAIKQEGHVPFQHHNN